MSDGGAGGLSPPLAADAGAAVLAAHSRSRGVVRTTVAVAAARAVSLATGFALVPLLLGHLGPDRYGIVVAAGAFTSFLQVGDLGVANALIGYTALERARHGDGCVRAILAHAVALLALLGLGLFALLWGALVRFDVPALLGIAPASAGEAGRLLLALGGMFCAGLPLTAAPSIRSGLQQGDVNGRWAAVAAIANLVAAGATIAADAGLVAVAIASSCGPLLANAANAAGLARIGPAAGTAGGGASAASGAPSGTPPCTTPPDAPFRVSLHALARSGGAFLVLQVCALASFSADPLLISRFVGQAELARYSVVLKLFSMPSLVLGTVCVALWPAFADALARGDARWIEAAIRRAMTGAAAFSGACALVLGVLAEPVIRLWTGQPFAIEPGLRAAMMGWTALGAAGAILSTVYSGLGVLRFQAIAACIATAANLALSWHLVQRIGVAGPIAASCAVMSVNYLVAWGFLRRRVLPEALRRASTT